MLDGEEPLDIHRHGGRGGAVTQFHLDDDEYITGISGRAARKIDCLTLHTNKRNLPTVGGRGGMPFEKIEAPEGFEVIGFHGRADAELDAIGIISRKRL